MSIEDNCARYDAPGFLMQRGTRLFARLVDRSLVPLGVRYGDLPVLLQLRRDGPSLQRDLLREALVGQPAMVATVTRLEVAGLVERRSHGTDRRASLIVLTPDGERVALEAMALLQDANEQAVRGLVDSERSAAMILLKRIIVNLGDETD